MKDSDVRKLVAQINAVTNYALRAFDRNLAPWWIEGAANRIRRVVDMTALRDLLTWLDADQRARGYSYPGEARALKAATDLRRALDLVEQHRDEIAGRLAA